MKVHLCKNSALVSLFKVQGNEKLYECEFRSEETMGTIKEYIKAETETEARSKCEQSVKEFMKRAKPTKGEIESWSIGKSIRRLRGNADEFEAS